MLISPPVDDKITATAKDGSIPQAARAISWVHGLDLEQVCSVLRRLQPADHELYLTTTWHPSFTDALLFLRPEVALSLFSNGDLIEIQGWMEQTSKLIEP